MHKKRFFIMLLLAACTYIVNAQKNIAMYNAKDAKTYYLNTNTTYHYPFYVTDMAGSWTNFTNKIKYSYRINNNTAVKCSASVDHNKNWNCVNAPGLSKYRIVLPNTIAFSTIGTYTLTIWIDSLDGVLDANQSNDTLVRIYKAIDNCPMRKGLLEYGYHVSCGPCGEDGTPFFENTINQYSQEAVCVKLHNYSATTPLAWATLNCAEATIIDNTFGSTAHPDFTWNRASMQPFDDDDKFYPKYCPADSAFFIRDLKFNNSVPVVFSFSTYSLSSITNKIKFSLDTKFLDAITFTKDTRLSVMLVEDSIWYYMANNGVATIPDSIHHRYVLRKVFGSPFGEAGTIPSAVSANQIVNYVVNDSVNTAWNKKQLYLIPTIMYNGVNKNDHEILQAQLFSCAILTSPLGISNKASNGSLAIYPNPAKSIINITCNNNIQQLAVYSIDGKMCMQLHYNTLQKKQQISVETLYSGTYIIKLQDENGGVHHQKMIIEK